ncbi:cytochrome P450 [Poronia punctata]|nr:cytochrome P450 [Poronia punctata]
MGALGSMVLGFLAQYWAPVAVLTIGVWLVRNRYYNGLNKYPGPFLASLTDLWRFFEVWGRRSEVTHRQLHAKYGDVVRLGPNTLSFADPAALKTIYGLNKGFVKSDFYVVQQGVSKGRGLATLFSTTDNTFHAQLRRCVNSAFSMSALVQYEPFVNNTIKLFFDQTERFYVNNPEGCDFVRWMQFYAFDVIGEVTYSKRHGFLERNEDVDGIVKYLEKLFLYVAPVSSNGVIGPILLIQSSGHTTTDNRTDNLFQIGQIPWLDRVFLKNPIYLKLSEWGILDATNPIVLFARARMSERLGVTALPLPGDDPSKPLLPITDTVKSTASSPDLLSKFLAARDARPDFMNDKLVLAMAVSMAFAGSETTAISLSALFYNLLRNPQVLDSLRAELDDAARAGHFADNDLGVVTWSESQRLPYLDACVKEAFRMHPAAGLLLERIVPEPGVEIAGHYVKGGTIVGCSAWLIHRRPEIFGADVDVYRPERWLVDPSLPEPQRGERERRIREMNGHMFQFGMGPRTCIGKNISLLEMYKLVPSLLRRYNVSCGVPSFPCLSPASPTLPPSLLVLTLLFHSLNSRTQARSGRRSMHGSSSSKTSTRYSKDGN